LALKKVPVSFNVMKVSIYSLTKNQNSNINKHRKKYRMGKSVEKISKISETRLKP